MSGDYKALTSETLNQRLSNIEVLKTHLGADASLWTSVEVGDGNLNLVFIVTGPLGSIVVKQALPYVRVVGEGWPLTLKRVFFEHEALVRQAKRTDNMVPEVYYFDLNQAILIMEFIEPHVILRHSLKDAVKHPKLAHDMGIFCAQTLFRGSDLSMTAPNKKADLGIFSDNVALCNITEDLVFTDPYYDADSNNINSPALDEAVKEIRADIDLKIAVQALKAKFCTQNETLLHGDLHTGSIMVTKTETKIIDPEFATYGPIGFDIGMLLANFWMAYFAQQGYEANKGERDDYRNWILEVTEDLWASFCTEFTRLWNTERNGILFDKNLFEAQDHEAGAAKALAIKLDEIWQESQGFAGAEMIRRTIGLAHIMEIDDIEDLEVRAISQRHCMTMGRVLIKDAKNNNNINEITNIAIQIEKEASQ